MSDILMSKGRYCTYIASKSEKGLVWMLQNLLEVRMDYHGCFMQINNDVYDDMKQSLIAETLEIEEI